MYEVNNSQEQSVAASGIFIWGLQCKWYGEVARVGSRGKAPVEQSGGISPP